MLHLAVNHQVAYTKARLKSVLPTEKKKKKESQVHNSGFSVSKYYKDLVFQVSQAPLITEVEEVHELDGDGEGNSKPRRWSQVSQPAHLLNISLLVF